MCSTARILLWGAIGDALGVPYEGQVRPELPLVMSGRTGFQMAPGEWSDDTSMTLGIAVAAARFPDLGQEFLEGVVRMFVKWAGDCGKGIGAQTAAVTRRTRERGISSTTMFQAAREYSASHPTAAGNGALMRTSVVGCLTDDRDHAAVLADHIARLTHAHDSCSDSSVLWTEAVRRARLTGELNMEDGLDLIPASRRDQWAQLIADVDTSQTEDFTRSNGWTVHAFQESWSLVKRSESALRAVKAAVWNGGDTDTIAAITGSLAGAVHRDEPLLRKYTDILHGWPGMTSDDVTKLGQAIDRARVDRNKTKLAATAGPTR